MYEIYFYKDRNGKSPVKDYIKSLSEYGISLGEPYIKHLDDEIWELRPIRDRILFASWDGNSFVLLHHFVKKTQKTPAREIEQAKRNLSDLRNRSDDDE
ncbi:MAG: type II toxin-antitoxin system RelE/ParE family toxin [Oscillospiraceae bacterium]|nr:type II toxin-antitoxin system RelE/ParE family toxin [Oscillospiraceae bacterium]